MENADKILVSLSGLQKATPPPYLASRVMAKLKADTPSFFDRLQLFISKPSVVLASVVVLISLNLLALKDFNKETSEEVVEDTATMNDFENNFAVNYFNYPENEK